jgi:hypothetical protein
MDIGEIDLEFYNDFSKNKLLKFPKIKTPIMIIIQIIVKMAVKNNIINKKRFS